MFGSKKDKAKAKAAPKAIPLPDLVAKLDEVIGSLDATESTDPYVVDAKAFAQQARFFVGKQIEQETGEPIDPPKPEQLPTPLPEPTTKPDAGTKQKEPANQRDEPKRTKS